MCQSRPAIESPIPVNPAIKLLGEPSNLDLVCCIAIEVSADSQGAREEKRGVNGR